MGSAIAVEAETVRFGQAIGVAASPVRLVTEARGRGSDYPEVDCLRGLLPPAVLAAAEDAAARAGVGADRVLIATGAIGADDYAAALQSAHGIAFEPLDSVARNACPLDDARLIDAAATGIIPVAEGDDVRFVIAPRGTAVRGLLRLAGDNPAQAARFRVTSADRLNRFVLRHAGKAIAARAAGALAQRWPLLSAAPSHSRGWIVPACASIALAAAFVWQPALTLLACELALATVSLAWLGLRLFCATRHEPRAGASAELRDDALPTYTVIAALYREASSVDGLLSAIERLDYPAAKLNVILAVEADDGETHAAIAARKHRVPVTVITVPAQGPRTKPKALNVALPFAHGTFTVIYDAEDRPEPDQLRRALQAFEAGGDALACVQARLCIDNTADGWLARLFTADYAGQFDVFLPGLATLELPLPLGGSSNHFRTATLRDIGAWDAYNVTEDADLGMRLARFGYRTGMIASTTYEEAPARLGPWLRQRTRWFKGWMQTWRVHMRAPRVLLRDLGPAGFLTFQLVVGGNVLAALVHPLFMTALIATALSGAWSWPDDGNVTAALVSVYGANIVIGYLTSAVLGLIGLKQRGLARTAWVLLLTPVHWLLLSLAGWRALFQFAVAPYAWEKTEHGLAKSSRLAANLTRSLLELENDLKAVKASRKLRVVADESRPNSNRQLRQRTIHAMR